MILLYPKVLGKAFTIYQCIMFERFCSAPIHRFMLLLHSNALLDHFSRFHRVGLGLCFIPVLCWMVLLKSKAGVLTSAFFHCMSFNAFALLQCMGL